MYNVLFLYCTTIIGQINVVGSGGCEILESSMYGNVILSDTASLVVNTINFNCVTLSPFTLGSGTQMRIDNQIFIRGTFPGPVITGSAVPTIPILRWAGPGSIVLNHNVMPGKVLNISGSLTQTLLETPSFVV